MRIASKLIRLVRSLVLLAMLSIAFPSIAVSPIACGGRVQPINLYDGTPAPTFYYDSASTLIANDNENRTVGRSGVFADLPGFLAIESEGRILVDGGLVTLQGDGYELPRLDVSGGTWAGDGTMTVEALGFLGGTISGSGLIALTGSGQWTAGMMSGSGTFMISAGVTLEMSGNGTKNFGGGRLFENAGEIVWSGGGNWNVNSGTGTMRNLPGGVVDMQTDASLNANYFETLVAENLGLWRKSVGTGTATLGDNSGGGNKVFHNRGVLEMQVGTVRMLTRGTSTHEGVFQVSSNATLRWSSGAHEWLGEPSFQGLGEMVVETSFVLRTNVNFGTLAVAFEGSAAVTGNGRISNEDGGTITVNKTMSFPGDVTIAGTLTLGNAAYTLTVNGGLILEA